MIAARFALLALLIPLAPFTLLMRFGMGSRYFTLVLAAWIIGAFAARDGWLGFFAVFSFLGGLLGIDGLADRIMFELPPQLAALRAKLLELQVRHGLEFVFSSPLHSYLYMATTAVLPIQAALVGIGQASGRHPGAIGVQLLQGHHPDAPSGGRFAEFAIFVWGTLLCFFLFFPEEPANTTVLKACGLGAVATFILLNAAGSKRQFEHLAAPWHKPKEKPADRSANVATHARMPGSRSKGLQEIFSRREPELSRLAEEKKPKTKA